MSTLQSALQSTQPSLSSLHSPAVAPLSRLSEPPLPPAPPPLSDSASAALLTARGWLHRELLSGFLAPDWDEVRYLSSALQLTTSSALLADLASLLTEIDCEISSAVLSRHSSLLSQATNIGQLQQKLTAAHSRLRSLYQSVQRIQSSLSTPYARLSSDSLQLSHLQSTCELLRQCQRVLGLVERLRAVEAVDAKDLVKVAGALSELRQVLQETDLSGIELVDAERPFIDEVEERVRGEGRRWLQLSLEGHNQADVGYALQVFYSLRSSDLVAIVDLTLSRALDTLSTHVRRMTDVTALTSTAAASKAPVKGAAPPTTSMSTFRSTLWDRVDSLLSSLLSLHTQMCTLEAVLQKKRDPSTHVLYLDVVSEQRWPKGVLHAWWQSTCELLEREMEATSRGSSFVRSVLVNEYPRLHAAFSALLGRLRGEGRELLRCLQVFEQAYLAKTLAKLNEPLQLMTTPTSTSASPTPLPSRSDVSAFIHCIDDALSSITDNDVELQVAVAGNVNRALATFAALCESRLNINDDRDVLGSSGTGHSSVALSAVQRINSELFLLLSAVKQQLSAAEVRRRYPSIGAAAVAKVERGWQSLHELSDAILTHLIRNVIAQLEAAVFTMQDDDFAASRAIPTEGSNAIVTLRKRLSFLTKQLLPSYTSSLHDTSKLSVTATIVQQVSGRLCVVYLRSLSLVQAIGDESVRLRVTAELVQLEGLLSFSLGLRRKDSAMCALHDYKDQLLFLTDDQLSRTWQPPLHVDRLSVVHFLFASSGIPDAAVHRLLGLRVRAYIRRVEAAGAAEREALLMQAYEAAEAKLQIPSGPEGKGWVKLHFPRLEAARTLIREAALHTQQPGVAGQNGTAHEPAAAYT